jgi:DNA polymerase III delta subunit
MLVSLQTCPTGTSFIISTQVTTLYQLALLHRKGTRDKALAASWHRQTNWTQINRVFALRQISLEFCSKKIVLAENAI